MSVEEIRDERDGRFGNAFSLWDSTTTTDRRLRVAMVPPLRAEVLTPMGNLLRTVSVRLPMAAGLIRRAVDVYKRQV